MRPKRMSTFDGKMKKSNEENLANVQATDTIADGSEGSEKDKSFDRPGQD